MIINRVGLELIKKSEGLRLEAYQDGKGVWTIGWGHTKGVKRGMVISYSQAEDFLYEDLEHTEKAVDTMVKVPITDNQFSALVSLVFNIGVTAFKNSTLLKLLNNDEHYKAANQFDRWIYDDGDVQTGLVIRRKREKELFLQGMP